MKKSAPSSGTDGQGAGVSGVGKVERGVGAIVEVEEPRARRPGSFRRPDPKTGKIDARDDVDLEVSRMIARRRRMCVIRIIEAP